MRVKRIIFFVLFTMPILAVAQGTSCDCLANLNETIKKTEENYAGFPAKVNAGYHTLVKSLQSKAASEHDGKRCFYLIRDYVRFFKDKHFSFTYMNADDADIQIAGDLICEGTHFLQQR